jgi:hypothetical protein
MSYLEAVMDSQKEGFANSLLSKLVYGISTDSHKRLLLGKFKIGNPRASVYQLHTVINLA